MEKRICTDPTSTLTQDQEYHILKQKDDKVLVRNDDQNRVWVSKARFEGKVKTQRGLFLHVGKETPFGLSNTPSRGLPSDLIKNGKTFVEALREYQQKVKNIKNIVHPKSLVQLLAIYFSDRRRAARTFYRNLDGSYSMQSTGFSRSLQDLRILLKSYYPDITSEECKQIFDVMNTGKTHSHHWCSTVKRQVYNPKMGVEKTTEILSQLLQGHRLYNVKPQKV